MTPKHPKFYVIQAIMSIAMALVILAAMGFGVYTYILPCEEEIRVPIDWNVHPHLMAVDPPVTNLTLKVSASRHRLNAMMQSGVTYKPDPASFQEGIVTTPVSLDDTIIPRGVKVESFHPEELSFKVEKVLEKEVFVLVMLAGQPASGYTVTELSVEPQRVTLRGPERLLKAQEVIKTMPVDVSQTKEPYTHEVPLALSESITEVSDTKTVTTTVVVEEEKAVRRLTVPVVGKNPPKVFDIEPPVIELVVRGPVQDLDNLPKNGEMASWIDLKGLKRGVYARRAVIALPLSVTLQDATPEVFTVQIK